MAQFGKIRKSLGLLALTLAFGCDREHQPPTATALIAIRDGVSQADSIVLMGGVARRAAANATLSSTECMLTHLSPGFVEGCSEPVPTVSPADPWLKHSGGLFDSEQRAPIVIDFPKAVHGITMETTGALRCSGASLGRMIGYRGGVEVINVSNVLIDPLDCGEDDITFGVYGQIPTEVTIDRLVLEGPDPWRFEIDGQLGRAVLYYTVTYDPSLSLSCATVTRGQTATCSILGAPDVIHGWQFVGPVIPETVDSLRVTSGSASSSWSGVGVVSGTVGVIVTADAQLDTLFATLSVLDRTDAAWRWDAGTNWTFRQDGTPLCAYTVFVTPSSSRLAANRRTSGCFENDQTQLVSIEPSVIAPAARDSGFTAAEVTGGPNAGVWYVTAARFYMDRTSEMNPDIRPGGATRSLSNSTDLRVCRNALGLPKNAPVSVNFHTYNSVCRGFSLDALYTALWAHEGFGTKNPLDPVVANGHEARRRIAARLPANDPYRISEPKFRMSYAGLRSELTLDVYAAEQAISPAADPFHNLVGNNYVTPQGNCGKAWVFDSGISAYSNITLTILRPPLAPICP